MSADLCIYRVSRIPEDKVESLPAVINADETDLSYHQVSFNRADPWEREIGEKRTIEYTTIDVFEAAEQVFGKRPVRMSSSSAYYLRDSKSAKVQFAFPGGETEETTWEELEKYRYLKQEEAYLYNREEIVCVENAYLLNTKDFVDKIISRQDLLDMLKKYFENEYLRDFNSVYRSEPVTTIMQAFFALDDDDMVVCVLE